MSAPAPRATAVAPLLYWLLIVSGLVGLTLRHVSVAGDWLPLWVGSVVGVAIGQMLAWFRVRGWFLAIAALGGTWVFAFFEVSLRDAVGPSYALSFLPALVCGYLSLSERGGLVAFWYPAMLWMLLILDGPMPGALHPRAVLPFVLGLGLLFVAFLRARATRAVVIWRDTGLGSRATPVRRSVIHASPQRAASGLAWTGLTGVAALVLAAWIAPHLWQKEKAPPPPVGHDAPDASGVCCPEPAAHGLKETHVSEYFSLLRGEDEDDDEASGFNGCMACPTQAAPAWTGSGTTTATTAQALAPAQRWDTVAPVTNSPITTGGGGAVGTMPVPALPTTVSQYPVSPVATAPSASLPAASPVPQPQSRPAIVIGVARSWSHSPSHSTGVGLMPTPAAPLPDPGTPWKYALAFSLGGLALYTAIRVLRRKLTLAHLARPFWPETVDQRISNHWQRMLIGLGDAGIQPTADEQPSELAERVGIAEAETCATILERARHGVRIEEADLDTMHSAADVVYRTARGRAGSMARAAAWLRWPLA